MERDELRDELLSLFYDANKLMFERDYENVLNDVSERSICASLKEAFSAFGEIASARIIMDRATGRSKGFGFVEIVDDEKGEKAVKPRHSALGAFVR